MEIDQLKDENQMLQELVEDSNRVNSGVLLNTSSENPDDETSKLRNEIARLQDLLKQKESVLSEFTSIEKRYSDLQSQYETTLAQYRTVLLRIIN